MKPVKSDTSSYDSNLTCRLDTSTLVSMQAQRAPPTSDSAKTVYTPSVSRRPRADRGPRPKQGAHLLALRKKAGLTQIELASAVGVPQATIAFWEWTDKPPRSDVLPKMAKALSVTVED